MIYKFPLTDDIDYGLGVWRESSGDLHNFSVYDNSTEIYYCNMPQSNDACFISVDAASYRQVITNNGAFVRELDEYTGNWNSYTKNGVVYHYISFTLAGHPWYLQGDTFSDIESAIDAIYQQYFNINYRLTNCTAPSAPVSAAFGTVVTVPLVFTSGYGIVNPASDIYVTNNGVLIPSTYSNGVLTFTIPNLL